MLVKLRRNTWFYLENKLHGRLFADADNQRVKVDPDYQEGQQYLWRFHWKEDICLIENKAFGLCWAVANELPGKNKILIECNNTTSVDTIHSEQQATYYFWQLQETNTGYFVVHPLFGDLSVDPAVDRVEDPLNFSKKDITSLSKRFIWNFVPFEEKPHRWMEDLEDQLTLKDICLPGTRHSAMYEVAPFCQIEHPCRFQKLNVYQQLNIGVRYFDLQPVYLQQQERDKTNHKHSGIYLYAGNTIGPPLEDVLDQIVQYYNSDSQLKNEKDKDGQETIILRFSAFKHFDLAPNQRFVALIKEKLEGILLEKKLVGRSHLSHLPLSDLRSKVIVLLKEESDQKLYYPWAITENMYACGEELGIDDEYDDYPSYDAMEQDRLEKLLLYDDPDRLLLSKWTLGKDKHACLLKMGEGNDLALSSILARAELSDRLKQQLGKVNDPFEKKAMAINQLPCQNEKQTRHHPLFARNQKQQKVNILLQDFVTDSQAVAACRYHSSEADSSTPRFGTSIRDKKQYLIRPLSNVHLCLQLLKERGAESPSLGLCAFAASPLAHQVFTFLSNSIGQQRGFFAMEKLAEHTLLGTNDPGAITGLPSGQKEELAEWLIEPYYKPVINENGKVYRYKRQTACYLMVHAASRLHLSINPDDPLNTSVILRPYEKEKDNRGLIWFFEEVLN